MGDADKLIDFEEMARRRRRQRRLRSLSELPPKGSGRLPGGFRTPGDAAPGRRRRRAPRPLDERARWAIVIGIVFLWLLLRGL